MWHTKIWISSDIGCPDIGSPFDFGWKKEGAVLTPVFVRVKIIEWSVVPVSRMVCHAPNCAPVLPILTNVAMQLQVSLNMIIMKKNNIKIKRLCVQNKRLKGLPMDL